MLKAQGLLDPDKALPREDGSPEHTHLQIHDGFDCNGCSFRTVSLQSMKRHYSDPGMRDQCRHYGQTRPSSELDELFRYVFLQTWVNGPQQQYWIIERNGSLLRPIGGQRVQDHLRSMRERERERERIRTTAAFGVGDCHSISSEQLQAPSPELCLGPASLTFAEKGPWIERTGWEEMYRGKDRSMLSALMERPDVGPRGLGHDLVLGYSSTDSSGKDVIISPAADERKISATLDMFDRVMDRCEETARKTSRGILCWLRSNRALSCYPKPFTFVSSPSTTKVYRLWFKKCLALTLRVYRMDSANRVKFIGSRLSKKQLRHLELAWNHAYWTSQLADAGDAGAVDEQAVLSSARENRGPLGIDGDMESINSDGDEERWTDDDGDDSDVDEDDDYDYDYDDDEEEEEEDAAEETQEDAADNADALIGSQTGTTNSSKQDQLAELLEYLFGLTMSLCTQTLINSQPSSTIFIYASGILGFSSTSTVFLPARSYTKYLSGLIYIQRFIFLGLALPLRRYTRLGIAQRPRINQL
ncbi:hypothetical protein NW767_014158 [Fusarium falciforme]|nr:hypothetical protein NW767_014158 [Fusarium falciforme]